MRGALLALGRPAMESPAAAAAAAAAVAATAAGGAAPGISGAGAPARHVLLLTLHHAIGDGWSLGVLVRELVAFYDSFTSGGGTLDPAGLPAGLTPLPIQYCDYAVWQRQWLRGEVLATQLDYWRRQLAGVPPQLALPTDRPRPPARTSAAAIRRTTLPAAALREVRQLARACGGTLFMTALAAWQIVLARHAGQDDVVVGTPIAGRTRGETEGLIGFFINSLALRARIAERATFPEVLAGVRDTTLGAFAHQDLPFERLVLELQPERDLGHSPLYQVSLILQNTPPPPRPPAGLTLAALPETGTGAKFDLTLALREDGAHELSAALEFNRDLFDAPTAERLLGAFAGLLRAAARSAASPAPAVWDLELMDTAQRHQVVHEWGCGALGDRFALSPAAPAQICLHHMFEGQARRHPEAVAVIQGANHLTYGALDRRAERLAGRLRALGVGADTPVGLCAERSPELIVAILAILKAGGAWLPLDPDYPADRLEFMAADARLDVLLVDRRGAALSGLAPAAVRVQIGAAPADPADAAAEHAGGAGERMVEAPGAAQPESAAYLIYTSGSTGRPKGVVVPHRAILNHMVWMGRTLGWRAGDRMMQRTSPSFDASVWEIWMPLVAGTQLVLLPPGGHGDPAHLLRAVADQQVTVLQMVPSLLAALLEEPGIAAGSRSLRCLCCGAEALPADLVRRFRAAMGDAHGVELYNLYGPTEATIDSISWRCASGRDDGARALPIGRPIDDTEVAILDARGGLVPAGVAGELHLGGTSLARGYLARPALTARRFVPNAHAAVAGSRLYRTGDLVRMRADGVMEFLGRTDNQVKLRGFRIELGEIETTLMDHPAVVQAAVALRDDLPGGPRLVAYTVADPALPPAGAASLAAHLRTRLPEPMIPAAFVTLAALPLTASGKLDRRRLPRPSEQAAGTGQRPPRDEVELRLAKIWSDLLGAPAVGPQDSFFGLGGHSLLAVRLMNRIAAAFGQRLPLAALFESPTLEALAARLRRLQGAAAGAAAGERRAALVHLHGSGDGAPLFAVHPAGGNVLCYWQLAQALGDTPVYGLQLPDELAAPGGGAAAMAGGGDAVAGGDAAPGSDAAPGGGGAAPAVSVEALAAHYIDALSAVQPDGPVRLVGWSLGGVIAFEMARRLASAGRAVARLVLIDSYAPAAEPALAAPLDPASLVRLFAADLCGLLGLPAAAPDIELPADEAGALRALDEHGRAQGVLPADLDRASIERLYALFKTGVTAVAAYCPAPYAGKVELYTAQDTGDARPDAERGWRPWAAGGLCLRPLAGDHYALLRHPAVAALAAALGDAT